MRKQGEENNLNTMGSVAGGSGGHWPDQGHARNGAQRNFGVSVLGEKLSGCAGPRSPVGQTERRVSGVVAAWVQAERRIASGARRWQRSRNPRSGERNRAFFRLTDRLELGRRLSAEGFAEWSRGQDGGGTEAKHTALRTRGVFSLAWKFVKP